MPNGDRPAAQEIACPGGALGIAGKNNSNIAERLCAAIAVAPARTVGERAK
jgi:hypothetical protein